RSAPRRATRCRAPGESAGAHETRAGRASDAEHRTARSAPDRTGVQVVDRRDPRRLAPRGIVPPRRLAVHGAVPARVVARRRCGRTRDPVRQPAAGPVGGVAQFRGRGGSRQGQPGIPRAGRAGEGHGVGRGPAADGQRRAVLGAPAMAAPRLNRGHASPAASLARESRARHSRPPAQAGWSPSEGRIMRAIRRLSLLLLALLLSGCGYNTIQTKDEAVKASWSEVLNQYQRRADLVPNLVNTVKGYAAHEEAVFTQVTNARAKVGQTTLSVDDLDDAAKMAQFQAAQGELSSALSRLMVVSENYPQLKADGLFQNLQAQLEGTENRVTVARQ